MPPRSKRIRTIAAAESDDDAVDATPTTQTTSRVGGKQAVPRAQAESHANPEQGNTSARDAMGLPPPDASQGDTRRTNKHKKKKKVTLNDILGSGDLKDGDENKSSGFKSKRERPVNATLKLGKHQTGDNKGQYTGRVFFAMNCDFEENSAYAELVHDTLKQGKPMWFKDWNEWGVRCPTAALALLLFNKIKASEKLKVTARRMNKDLDLTPYDNPAVTKYEFTLASSECQFETRVDGILPRSIMLVGKTYEFKDFLKERFPTIRYVDLIFNGGKVTKAAWVLSEEDQTAETGTLADFLESLGATVQEVDLDAGDDEDDDAERDGDGFVDDEAEEEEGDDEKDA